MSKSLFKAVAITLSMLFLAACASVPLGTMWKFKRMGVEGLMGAEPAEILAAIQSSDQEFLGVLDPFLSFEITRDEEILHDWRFLLHEVKAENQHRLKSPRRNFEWRIFALDESDYESFRAMRQTLHDWGESELSKGSQGELSVKFFEYETLSEARPDLIESWIENHPVVSIDLQLYAEDGFFTLMKPTPIPFVKSEGVNAKE